MNNGKLIIGTMAAGIGMAAAHMLSAKSSAAKSSSEQHNYEAIDDYVDEQIRRLNIPGVALAIVEDNRLVHYRGFGHARPGGEPPSSITPFFIGSVTKSFTALAVMQLVEAGKLELDAPVQNYLPWFRVDDPQASAHITIRQLLHHTSGLPMSVGEIALADFNNQPAGLERQVRALVAEKLSSLPGARFDYNNTNYNILGLIIQVASGEAYADYVQNHIFKLLRMSHSYTSKAEAQKNGLAMGYRYWFGYPIPAPNLLVPLSSLPSGQLISCAEDMAHYLIAQINNGQYAEGRVLSGAGMQAMHSPAVEIREMGMYIGHYTMGWISKRVRQSTIVSHSGIVPEYGAWAGFIPEQKKGLVLLYNANHMATKLAFDEFGMGAAERLAGEVPSRMMFGVGLWLMRGLALIPALQMAGVLLTLNRLRRWRADPASRPTQGQMWRRHILLPLVPNLLLSLTLVPMLGKMRGWMRLFMPDFSWIAYINGSFAAIWAFLRTGLIIRALNRHRESDFEEK
jgi:CubicO group peptidase (beta-lactamase class C family)